jgi:hypothetical protein
MILQITGQMLVGGHSHWISTIGSVKDHLVKITTGSQNTYFKSLPKFIAKLT